MPRYANRIKLYDSSEPMFHSMASREIARIQRKHVPAAHGGSIVIEQTERCGHRRQQRNFRADRQDADEDGLSDESAGGAPRSPGSCGCATWRRDVNDFIDMRDEKHRRGVERAIARRHEAWTARRTKILKISAFGIIEMTAAAHSARR